MQGCVCDRVTVCSRVVAGQTAVQLEREKTLPRPPHLIFVFSSSSQRLLVCLPLLSVPVSSRYLFGTAHFSLCARRRLCDCLLSLAHSFDSAKEEETP